MRNQTNVPTATFKALFAEWIPATTFYALLRRCGVRRRCPPVVTAWELMLGLVFHVVMGAGTLAQHVHQLTGKTITDGALAQRRARWPLAVFAALLAATLRPKAEPARQPEAFYQGLRLCGVDGCVFSVANTPQHKKQLRKAQSRRGRAAFPKVGVAVLVELGWHNPLAAAFGAKGESERVLARQVLAAQPAQSLLIGDRYYGVPRLVVDLPAAGERHFLVRVKQNLRRRVLAVYPDGSALVEIRSGPTRRLGREIQGWVRRGAQGRAPRVRLWTSRLDWPRYPAAALLALYAQRWEQELFYKEFKTNLGAGGRLQSHTPRTALQEIAALILAYARLVDYRLQAATTGAGTVLRISFLQTLQVVQGLWSFLELAADLLTPAQVRLVVRRAVPQIAERANPKRRLRACPRALRQPVSRWPRLRKNTCRNGAIQHSVRAIQV